MRSSNLTRRGLLGGLLATSSVAGAQAWRPWQPGVGRPVFQFLGGGAALPINQRDPTANDDSTKSFAVNDLWRNGASGAVFRATSISAGAAVWTSIGTPPLPLDAVTGAVVAYGPGLKLPAAYAGAGIQALAVTAAANQDIGFVSNVGDAASLNAFISAHSSDTIRVSKIYDQTGNGFDATPTTTSTRGPITAASVALRGVALEPVPSTDVRFDIPTSVAGVSNQNLTIVSLPLRTRATRGPYSFGEIGQGTATKKAYLFSSGFGQGSNSFPQKGVGSYPTGRAVGVYTQSASTISHRVGNDRISASTDVTTAEALTGGRIGGIIANTNYPLVSALAGYIVYPALTLTQEQAVLESATYWLGATPQWDKQLIETGDSITQGVGDSAGSDGDIGNITSRYQTSITTPVRFINLGVSGQTLATIKSPNFAVSEAVLPRAGRLSVLHIWAGTNDIAATATDATTYSNLQSVVTAAFSAGYTKILIGTMLPRYDVTVANGKEAYRLAYNNSIRTGALSTTSNVTIIDYASMSQFSTIPPSASPTTYQIDGIHPNKIGYDAIQAYRKPYLDAALGAS